MEISGGRGAKSRGPSGPFEMPGRCHPGVERESPVAPRVGASIEPGACARRRDTPVGAPFRSDRRVDIMSPIELRDPATGIRWDSERQRRPRSPGHSPACRCPSSVEAPVNDEELMSISRHRPEGPGDGQTAIKSGDRSVSLATGPISPRIEEIVLSTGIGSTRATPSDPAAHAQLLDEVRSAAVDLDRASATEIIEWSVGRFGGDLVMAASFQDAVLIDLCVKVDPKMLTIFLDTHFHFPETLAYLRRIRDRYDLNLEILEPTIADDVSPCGSPDCCALRKVAPLNAMLETRPAWITGLKRVDTPERKDAPVVSYDEAKHIVKINPMASWTDDDVDRYVHEHGLPRHPLNSVGYVSIGCAPTTRPVAPGEDPRAGRWPDSDKTECGLHI